MSHTVEIETKMKDLAALEAAAKELGWRLVRNVSTFNCYINQQEGRTSDGTDHCTHKLKFNGVNYEIGVRQLPGGDYALAMDAYGYEGSAKHDGHKLESLVGEGCKKLTQLYAVQKATLEARRKGLTVRRLQCSDGSVKLAIGGIR